MQMSLSAEKSMLRPVGNSPGPETISSRTSGQLLSSRPSLSSTVTMSCTSSVPSASMPSVSEASMRSRAGVPSTGHSGGAWWEYSFLYQYHERLGRRK